MELLFILKRATRVYLLLVFVLISCKKEGDDTLKVEKKNEVNNNFMVLITGDTLQTKVPIKIEGKKIVLNKSGVVKTKLQNPPRIIKRKNALQQ